MTRASRPPSSCADRPPRREHFFVQGYPPRMPLVPFRALMQEAERGNYAVGYFECWNLESLLAVADAAERMRSPVILGFSGIYLPHPERRVADPLAVYAAMGTEVGRCLTVPCCLLFNESP